MDRIDIGASNLCKDCGEKINSLYHAYCLRCIYSETEVIKKDRSKVEKAIDEAWERNRI